HDAALVELAQAPGLVAVIERDQGSEERNHQRHQHIGCHDEECVGPERHGGHAARWLACIICKLRSRRRRISLRIAARCSVRNNSVNASAITSSGIRKARSSVGPSIRNTEAGWCSVFHQSTENLMIGRLIAPTRVKTAAARAAREGAST